MTEQPEKKKFSFPPARFFAFGLSALFAVSGVALLALTFSPQEAARDTAFSQGQAARILVENGAVEGNLVVRSSAKENREPEVEADKEPMPEEAPLPVEEEPEPEPTPEAEPAPEPAPEEEKKEPEAAEPVEEPVAEMEPEPKPELREETKKEPVKKKEPAPVASGIVAPLKESANPSLYETMEGTGKLPVKSAGGLESWQYYGKPDPDAAHKRPAVALVVAGLGLDRAFTRRAMELPEWVSFSFSPYADALEEQIARARALGHEVWLDLPLEPLDYPASDAGPLALLKDLPEANVKARLYKVLARGSAYVGVVGSANEGFSEYAPMHGVAVELKERGLLALLRSGQYADPATADHVLQMSVALGKASVDAAPEQGLEALAALAREKGFALGVVEDTPSLLKRIPAWADQLRKDGMILVPASALASRKK
jgi:polysaccharide deacetylase 2 family uncharacterized protein YibQ